MQAPPSTLTARRCRCSVEETSGLTSGFNSEECHHQTLASLLSSYLQRLTKAPLKPQEQIFALEITAFPKLYYHKALGHKLIRVDRKLTATVSLGISLMRTLGPLHRCERLMELVLGRNPTGLTDPYLAKEIRQCDVRFTSRISLYGSEQDIKKRWAVVLLDTVKGGILWIADGTYPLTRKDHACTSRNRGPRGKITGTDYLELSVYYPKRITLCFRSTFGRTA